VEERKLILTTEGLGWAVSSVAARVEASTAGVSRKVIGNGNGNASTARANKFGCT
jgi:hypothetical protein